MKFISRSEAETMAWAAAWAQKLKGGETIFLRGELGAGKTTFVRGLARAFGIKESIRSPTFTLIRLYKIKNQKSKIKNLLHLDAYRLKDAQDLRAIGLSEYLNQKETVVLIEWGERAAGLKIKKTLSIKFHHGQQPIERIISTRHV